MEQRILGRTGVSVSKLCLGAMMFGGRQAGQRRPGHQGTHADGRRSQ